MAVAEKICRTEVTVLNAMGLHARPASCISQMIAGKGVKVTLSRPGESGADAASVLELLILAAGKGSRLELAVEGENAPAVLDELAGYFRRGFDELNEKEE